MMSHPKVVPGSSFMSTSSVWDDLNVELQGSKVLEKPRVSKKVLVKALRIQSSAMRSLIEDVHQLSAKMRLMEGKHEETVKHIESMNNHIDQVEKTSQQSLEKIRTMEKMLASHAKRMEMIDELDVRVEMNAKSLKSTRQDFDVLQVEYKGFAETNTKEMKDIKLMCEEMQGITEQMDQKLENQQVDMILSSDQVLIGDASLTKVLDDIKEDSKRRQIAIKETEATLFRQSDKLQEIMLDTRRTVDENTFVVEGVQRSLLEKADRDKVDETIESKYEEIIEHLQTALKSVNEDEGEFKRVCKELQELVEHLSTNKADRKELMEVKEQVMYDSRVRQQVENMRTFIDLKINRDEVYSELKNKADKDEMVAMLEDLSRSMTASINHAQQSLSKGDAEQHSAFSVTPIGRKLPKLGDDDRCWVGNTRKGLLPDRTSSPPTATMLGGGFSLNVEPYNLRAGQLKSLSPVFKRPSSSSDAGAAGAAGAAAASDPESVLLGVDGHFYQGDKSNSTGLEPEATVSVAASSLGKQTKPRHSESKKVERRKNNSN